MTERRRLLRWIWKCVRDLEAVLRALRSQGAEAHLSDVRINSAVRSELARWLFFVQFIPFARRFQGLRPAPRPRQGMAKEKWRVLPRAGARRWEVAFFAKATQTPKRERSNDQTHELQPPV